MAKQKRRKPKPQQRSAEPTVAQQREEWRKAKAEDEALATVDPVTLYGRGDCKDDADAQCFDRNRSTIAGAISVPPVPFQNRPTFQQTVEVTQHLPR